MNFTIQNFVFSDLTICYLYNFILLFISILWILIISLFFQIALSKIISDKITKYLRNKFINSKLDFCFQSVSFNFFLLRFVFKNVNLCIDNFCHIEIPIVQMGLNRFKTIAAYSSISNKKFIFYFIDAKAVFFDEIIFNKNESNIIILDVPLNLICFFQNLTISLNHLNSEQWTTFLRIKNLAFIFENDRTIERFKFTIKNPIYKSKNFKFSSQKDLDFKNRKKFILVNFLDLNVGLIQDSKNFDFLKIKKAKLNFQFDQTQNYNFKNNDKNFDLTNLAFLIDIFDLEDIDIDIDPWNQNVDLISKDLILFWNKFAIPHENWVINVKIENFKFCLSNRKQKLIHFFSKNQLLIEIASKVDTFLVYKFLFKNASIKSFVDQDPFFYSSLIYLNIKIDSKIPAIKLSFPNHSSFCLRKIAANIELIDLIFNSRLVMNLNVKYVLIGSLEHVKILFPFNKNSLVIDVKQIGFKMEKLDSLMKIVILENLNFFTNLSFFNLEQNLSAKCERLIIELKSNVDGTKFQFILSPIQIGPDNLFEKLKIFKKENSQSNLSIDSFDSYLYTQMVEEISTSQSDLDTHVNLNNSLFLSVIQFRYESFKNGTETYSKFSEIVFGDIFGSLNFDNFFKLIDYSSSIWTYFNQELELDNFITKTKLNYSSLRISTSLINFSIFNNYDMTQPLTLFNFIISPIDHGSCDFHCENKSPGSLTTVTDISIKMFSSLDILKKNELVECGFFYFKFLSNLKINKCNKKEKILSYLIENDQFSKRLDFLWDSSLSECCCVEKNTFFSSKREIMYNFENDFVFKSSVYWLERSDGIQKVGFGQSILVENENIFFSYRKFFSEFNLHSSKIRTGKKFTVISNLESREKFMKNKFEPLEINVYDEELNTFMNESVDVKTLSAEEMSDLNFKSTNMTPPYFSNDFSLYIRYLPRIKKFSNIIFKPGKKSSSKSCFSEILYPEDGIKMPQSDLNTEFFSKTSTVFKRLRFNWLKSRKKSYKKSLIKKSLNLKEIKNLKFETNFSSLSSLSLNSLSDSQSSFNTNQNNNKALELRKKSHQDKLLKRKKSNLLIYEINLNQILHGFRQNEDNIDGKKLCVQEIYIQTLFLSDQYDYENSYKNFIFEKKTTTNQELNEPYLSASNKFYSSKAYFLLSKKSIDCVSNLVECMHKTIKTTQHVTQSECSRPLADTWENMTFDRHICVDEIYFKIVEISGDQDLIEGIEAFKFKTTSLYVLQDLARQNRVLVVRGLQIETFKQQFFPIEQLLNNVTNLISKINLSVSNLKIIFFDSIISQLKIPDSRIDFNFLSHFNLQIEVADLELIEPIAKLSILTDLIQFVLKSVNNLYLKFDFLNIKYKIALLIRNLVIRLILKSSSLLNSDNYLIYLSGKNLDFIYSNMLETGLNEQIKVKYSLNLRAELSQEIDQNSLILFECEINKRNLDAIFVTRIKPYATGPTFLFNLILPLVFESKFNFSNFDFEWTMPGMLIYSACDNSVYQLVDINNIKISLANYEEKLLVDLEKVRLIRSSINFDLFDQIEEFIHKIKFDYNFSSQYLLILKIKTLVFNYFSEGFLSKSWFFLKIFDVNLTYTFSHDSSLIEDVTLSFRDSLDSAHMDTIIAIDVDQGRLLNVKNSILLFISTKSPVLDQFDVNKWLEFCCLESRDTHGYNVRFIAAFPSLNLEFNFETKETKSRKRKSVNFYWKCVLNSDEEKLERNEKENPYFIVVKKMNLRLIEEKIIVKLKEQNALDLNRMENYLKDIRPGMNVRIKEIDDNWISEDKLDFFDSQNLTLLFKNCLLENILVIFKILGVLENNK